jgi:hypothetical protein
MDWVQDMTARWMRILSAAGSGRTPLDEAVHQISMISAPPAKKGRFDRLKRNASATAEASAVTVLCRQLVAGVIISDLIIDQLCTLSGQTRDQVLDQLSGTCRGSCRISSCAPSKPSCQTAAHCCKPPSPCLTPRWVPVSNSCSGWQRNKPQRLSRQPARKPPRSPLRLALKSLAARRRAPRTARNLGRRSARSGQRRPGRGSGCWPR